MTTGAALPTLTFWSWSLIESSVLIKSQVLFLIKAMGPGCCSYHQALAQSRALPASIPWDFQTGVKNRVLGKREGCGRREERALLCVGRQSHHVEKANLFQGTNLERK